MEEDADERGLVSRLKEFLRGLYPNHSETTNQVLGKMKKKAFVLLLAFPLMFGIISVSNKFVPIFYGEGYEKVVYLITIISPIIIAIGLSGIIGQQYLLPTKQQKKFTISVTAGAIVNFIFNMIFIKLWKSIGASIATVIAECTVTGIQFYLVKNEISFKEVFEISKKYLISSFVMLIISIIIGFFIKSNLVSIIVQIGVSGVIYFALLLIMKDELVFKGIDMIKSKVFK